jgi:putative membrane protein
MNSTAVQGYSREQVSGRYLMALIAIFVVVLAWSTINPHDYFTWFLEVIPAILGVGILGAVYPWFRFTRLIYTLVLLHCIILIIGGHYTYAEVPLFNWIRDTFHHARNNYDKVGHFAQGFVPAMIAREVLLRKTPLKRGAWLYVIVVGVCLGISALYELFEWAVAAGTGTAADAFLGSQGDPWDTQKDMATCMIGAAIAPLLLGRLHDSQLRRAGVPID